MELLLKSIATKVNEDYYALWFNSNKLYQLEYHFTSKTMTAGLVAFCFPTASCKDKNIHREDTFSRAICTKHWNSSCPKTWELSYRIKQWDSAGLKVTFGKQEQHFNKLTKDARDFVPFEKHCLCQFQSMLGTFSPWQPWKCNISTVFWAMFSGLW